CLIFSNGVPGLLDDSGVTGFYSYNGRDCTHQRQVIDSLVRCAISGRQPGQSRYNLHVSPPQRNVDSDKIIGPTGSKHAVSRGKRCEPGSGEACRNSDQILLRHAQLKKTAGKLLSEDVDISVLTQIGGQSDDVGAAP